MHPTLLLIDIHTAFSDPYWGSRNNPDAEENAGRLLQAWRARNAPVVHIGHISVNPQSPLREGQPGTAFHPAVLPRDSETVFKKNVNSAFVGTGLEAHLRAAGATDLVIAGLTTPHCVSTTARMAANLGFGVTLAHDACAAFTQNARNDWANDVAPMDAQMIHDSAISQLHGEFVTALSTETLLNGAS